MNEPANYSESDESKKEPDMDAQPASSPANATEPEEQAGSDVSSVSDPLETTPLRPRPDEEEAFSVIDTGKDTSNDQEPSIKAVQRCHVGASRHRNEDSCLIFSSEAGGHFTLMPFGLYVVADGMGGHAHGHIASKTASRVAAYYVSNNIYVTLLKNEEMTNQAPIQEVLTRAIQAANIAVLEHDETDSGTTLTVALVLGHRLHMAHVGDSRLYLLAGGKLEAITSDHSLVQRLQEVGQLTAEQATHANIGHILLNAVGQGEEVRIDTDMRRLPESGKLLLCSDGLYSMVPDAEIQKIMEQDIFLEEIADQLFESAMAAGGYDNITTILVDFTL
jgi:protein phosphatase